MVSFLGWGNALDLPLIVSCFEMGIQLSVRDELVTNQSQPLRNTSENFGTLYNESFLHGVSTSPWPCFLSTLIEAPSPGGLLCPHTELVHVSASHCIILQSPVLCSLLVSGHSGHPVLLSKPLLHQQD